MLDKAGPDWTRRGVLLAGVSLVVSVLTCSVTFLVGYTGSVGFRAWVDQFVGSVGPLVAALVAASVVGALAAAVWRYWRQLIRPFNWLGWMGKRLWVWLVCGVLSWPVRHELLGRANLARSAAEVTDDQPPITSAKGAVDAEEAASEGGCRAAVAELEVPPLLLLHVALQKYEEAPGDPARVGSRLLNIKALC